MVDDRWHTPRAQRRDSDNVLKAHAHRMPCHSLGVRDDDLAKVVTKRRAQRRDLSAGASTVASTRERLVTDVEKARGELSLVAFSCRISS